VDRKVISRKTFPFKSLINCLVNQERFELASYDNDMIAMAQPAGVARSPSRQERRYRRFKLRYPVHLLFHTRELVSEVDSVSRDVSIGGLLLECSMPVPQHSAVNFVISLRARALRPVELVGEGKVVRVERGESQTEFAVVLGCKKPITQIEAYLPGDSS
jgi:hypothetical protein